MTDADDAFTPIIVHRLTEAEMAPYLGTFDVHVLTDHAGTMVLRHAGGGGVLAFPPRTALALVAAPGTPIDAAEAWVRAAGLDLPVLRHRADVPGLLAAAAGRMQRSARLAGEVTLRLAALRTQHENLQNAYEGLRAFVQERGLLLPTLGFLAQPDRDGSVLPPRTAEATQYIPVDFRSLCGVALHVANIAEAGGQGALEVTLTSPENPALRVAWRVGYDRLQPGWNTFVFEGLAPTLRTSTLLGVRFRTLAGEPPRLSLARPHLRPDRAAVADGEPLSRPLAFRAWTGIPGAPLTLTAKQWPAFWPGEPAATLARIEVLDTDDFALEDVRGLGAKLDFQPVRKLPRQRRILIHPLGPKPSIGRIPRGCPPGTREIRVEVETDHPEAHDLEYGVALGTEPELDIFGQPTDEFTFDPRCDWLVTPAKTPGTLVIELPAPLTTATDLVLVCRCPPGSGSDWGWAHVTRLTLLGEFAPGAFAGGPLVEAAE